MSNFPTSAPNLPTNKQDNVDDVVAADYNNQSGEINAIAAKIGTGSSTPDVGKALMGTGVGTSAWQTISTDPASAIHAATDKTTPVDADEIGITDSAASYVLKKLSWANLKATVKTYFDTLYQTTETATQIYEKDVVCKVATTASITLSGTQTIDGVACVAGDYVLVKNQATASQNGVYVVASGAWSRATEYDATLELDQKDIFVSQGTTNAKTWWLCATKNATVGTTSLSFAQIPNGIGTGADQALAGNWLPTTTTEGTLINGATAKTTPVDADYIGLMDSAASNVLKKLSWANVKATLLTWLQTGQIFPINAPQGFLINGKIVPSVTSNNLIVAIKTLAGNDPSDADPVYVRIGDTVRKINAATSVTAAAGTNWCNAGGAELAAKEIDYFVYLGWSTSQSKVMLSFSRVSFSGLISDFSSTTTNEKYALGYANFNTTDSVEIVGRFAATLSAGAGYTWTVPTFTNVNLIQRPIFETRRLSFASTVTGLSPISGQTWAYKLVGTMLYAELYCWGTSNATTFTVTLPFALGTLSASTVTVPAKTNDSGVKGNGSLALNASSNVVNVYKTIDSGAFTASGVKALETTAIISTLT